MKLNELLQRNNVAASPEHVPVQPNDAMESLSGNRVQHLQAILSIIRKINTSLILSDVLALVMDHAIRITQADRGFLMLADGNKQLQYALGHDKHGAVIPAENFVISKSALDDVFLTGESLCIEDALNDERFERRESVINLELKTIICSPLKTQEETIGVIYVDSRHIHPIQKEEILQLFEILAGHAAFAIRNARLYENLQTAYNELREANEHIIRSERMAMRGEIAGEVSHELNNILSVALCQCYALQRHLRKSENPDADNALKQITLSLRRMTNFSENLLVGTSNNSKMEAVHFNTVIKNFVAFISVLPKFKKALIHTEFDEELNDVQIDVDQFQQVLLNIANNAMDAKYNANLSFRTEYDFVKNIARLSISDDGPGIDPKIREKLFTERITTKPDGHGFGLPLCKKIIQNHHGEISVDSEPGFGTRFIMAFPIPI